LAIRYLRQFTKNSQKKNLEKNFTFSSLVDIHKHRANRPFEQKNLKKVKKKMSKNISFKLATTLKSVRPLPGDHDNGTANPIASRAAEQAWSDAVQAVAIVCLNENSAFRTEKFFDACGGLFD
jgi:hypothetical protein